MKSTLAIAVLLACAATWAAEKNAPDSAQTMAFPSIWSSSQDIKTKEFLPGEINIKQTVCGYDKDHPLLPCTVKVTAHKTLSNKCTVSVDNLIINFAAGSQTEVQWLLEGDSELQFRWDSISIATSQYSTLPDAIGQPTLNSYNDRLFSWRRVNASSSAKVPRLAYVYDVKVYYRNTPADAPACGIVDPLIISHG